MATGDSTDMLGRMKAVLPPWFGDDDTPILDSVLAGPAVVLAFVYSLIVYVTLQLRIATATDGFLDLASYDYFGNALPRMTGEADAAFSARIRASFFPSRNIRSAVVGAIASLGLSVQIIEPWNPGDTGPLGIVANTVSLLTESGLQLETESGQALLIDTTTVGLAWNTIGSWGSRNMPFQCFAIVTRPPGSTVTNAQIYAAIEAVRPVAIKVWTQIVG